MSLELLKYMEAYVHSSSTVLVTSVRFVMTLEDVAVHLGMFSSKLPFGVATGLVASCTASFSSVPVSPAWAAVA